MSQPIQEQLSALVDGELPREETLFLLRRMNQEPDLVRCWSAWHLVRQSLRRQEILPLRSDFAEAILQRVGAETVPAPQRRAAWLRWASGGAIAASVAVVALIATSPGKPDAPGAGAPLAVAAPSATPDLNGEFRPPLLSPPLDAQPASAGGFSTPSAPIDPRLQSYLIRHYDAAGGNGQAGLMPYVLLVVPSQQAASTPDRTAADQAAQRR
ncbi:MAG: sigma-E factor negative regulatory protein [Xanthomonadales bacterium]|nr:sigma-E factor negative regulatory protein [Xanthomonadales bacterium]